MTANRYGRVPAWLLPALHEVPVDRRGKVAPATALAAYAYVGATHASFKTGVARVTCAQVGAALQVSERSARRALRLLEHVGALVLVAGGRSAGRLPNVYEVRLDPPTRNPGSGFNPEPECPMSDLTRNQGSALPERDIQRGASAPGGRSPETQLHMLGDDDQPEPLLAKQLLSHLVGGLRDQLRAGESIEAVEGTR